MKNKRVISPSLFILILLCIALPFLTISCSNQEICSLSGYNLAFGGQIQGQKFDSSFAGVMLIILALIGIGLYFWKNRLSNLASALTGALGIIFTFVLKIEIDSKIDSKVQGLSVQYKVGFILTILLYIAAAGYNFYLYSINEKTAPQINEDSMNNKN